MDVQDCWSAPRRLDEAEEMDAAGVDTARLMALLKFIRRINAWVGYTRTTLRHLDCLWAEMPADRAVTILDVATGSADVPQGILRRARQSGRRVRVVGLDLHPQILACARSFISGDNIPLIRGDALALPFDDASVDVVMTSMFLHHLPTPLAVRVLREMDRVARHGVIVADLIRNRRAYGWVRLFTALADPIVRHDALVSVRQSFTMAEAAALVRDAGLDYLRVYPERAYRFVIRGAKPAPIHTADAIPAGRTENAPATAPAGVP